MTKPHVLLAVDLSYQVYRAAAAHPMLSYEDADGNRTFTGGLFGFFVSVSKAAREVGATRAIFCRDTKPYLRSRDYPEYKQLRASTMDPELKKRYEVSMRQVLETLQELGHAPWSVPGLESDDLIAHVVKRHGSRFDEVYAMSNDSDLFQLLTEPGFAVIGGEKDGVIRAGHKRLLGLTPEEFMLATALTGTHNDIEGIRGVGPVTAAKAVRNPALMRGHRELHAAMIDRNLELIRLPHPEMDRREPLPPGAEGKFSPRRMYRALGRYDIEVTASMVNSFEQLHT